jgi:hypothetical protein
MGFIQGHASHLPAIVSKERGTKIKRPIFRWGTHDHLQTWNIWVETLYNTYMDIIIYIYIIIYMHIMIYIYYI